MGKTSARLDLANDSPSIFPCSGLEADIFWAQGGRNPNLDKNTTFGDTMGQSEKKGAGQDLSI